MNFLQAAANQIKNEVPADQLPDGDIDSLFRMYAVLLFAKGEAVTNEDVHNAWVAWTAGQDPEHESLVPYRTLDQQTKSEDTAFTRAIKTVAAKLG